MKNLLASFGVLCFSIQVNATAVKVESEFPVCQSEIDEIVDNYRASENEAEIRRKLDIILHLSFLRVHLIKEGSVESLKYLEHRVLEVLKSVVKDTSITQIEGLNKIVLDQIVELYKELPSVIDDNKGRFDNIFGRLNVT